MNDPRRVCRVQLPTLPPALRANKRALGVYIAGAVFATGWWLFFDACVRSHTLHKQPTSPDKPYDPPGVAIKFDDWIPGISTTIGLVIVNLVNKQHLLDENGGLGANVPWNDDPIMWRTRMWLFIGFAFLAGGMAGSVALMIIKYMLNVQAEGYLEFGLASILQNVLLMLCVVLLWFSQRVESEYEYNLTL
ncbi:Vacuolar protein sorting-associated protein 68 [Malassezia vespertilionis]|uniref:Vps68p n=1 Tax=Malassezia vespertilionis TaxID=2020962 RepID=A0A2N1JH98_9BASI|nr:Vacuolar protein sorting-associated protein 68 [Malassezia vespertilionis]PKI85913.1 hypothetical protein MVES_000182 [Malassezia vespertilionis]WFD04862.1 Vacuolar protein sorting-associated protein 68 [Malassezia vespertilionis]